MAINTVSTEEILYIIEESDVALAENDLLESLRASFEVAKNTGVNHIALVYSGERLPSIETGFLHHGYDVAEENNAFTQAMLNHISKVGGEVAAENAKERAMAADRVYVKDMPLSEYKTLA